MRGLYLWRIEAVRICIQSVVFTFQGKFFFNVFEFFLILLIFKNWNVIAMLYQFLLYSEVSQLYAYIYPFPLGPPPTPIPPLLVITEYRAELPVLYSSFPLAVCFTRGSIHVSIPVSQFVSPSHSPPHPPHPTCRPYIRSPRLCLYSCSGNRLISTIFLDSTYMCI